MSDGKFKPGIDFYNSGGNKGQALALQEYATTHKNIKAVVVLIGANDYGFADIVQTCVTNWLKLNPAWQCAHSRRSDMNRFMPRTCASLNAASSP